MNSLPRRLAVFTPKGGTGKTSTAHSVGAALAQAGDRVLLFDLDAQANLSFWLGVVEPTLLDVIQGASLASVVQRVKGIDRFDVVASSGALVGAEGMLRARRGGELWLRQQLRTLPPGRWDWILFDCPPGLGILTVAALTAADFALSPAPPNVLDSAGVTQVVDHVEEIRDSGLNPELELLGVVPVRVDRRLAVTRAVLEQMAELLGERLLPVEIPQDVRLVEAPSYGVSIFEHAPRCRAAVSYRQLTEEIRSRVKARVG